MENTCLFSDQTKHYLCCFYQILDEMAQGLATAKLTQSISHNAIVQLLPHHRAAVRMSRNLIAGCENRAVCRLAQRVLEQRADAMDQLEAALPESGQPVNPQLDLRLCQRRMDLIGREMLTQMGAAPEGNRLGAVYLQELLPHCQGGARMARSALRYEVSPELEPILRTIAAQQCRDAAQARTLLRRMGCQTA